MSIPTTDLVLHLDANDLDSLTLDVNDKVEQWDDLSGEENHAIQATESRRPLWVDDALNGKPVLRFSTAAQNWLEHAIIDTAPEFTYFIVWSRVSATASSQLLGHSGDYYQYLQYGDTWFLTRQTSTSVPMASAVFEIRTGQAVRYTHAKRWVDGEVAATDQSPHDDIENWYFRYIGLSGYAGPQGDIAEVIIYDKELTTAQRQQVEQYLGEKWLDWDEAKSAEATINISAEASKENVNILLGESSTVNVSAEGSAVNGIPVSGEATISIAAEGAATAEEPPREASAESTISISAEASGTKITGVSSEALIEIIAEALGEKSVNREAQALLDIFSEADKTKGTTKGSDSTILISAEAEATTEILIHVGAEAIIDISAEGAVLKSINKDSEAVINILAQGDKMDDYLSNFKGTLIKIIVST